MGDTSEYTPSVYLIAFNENINYFDVNQ